MSKINAIRLINLNYNNNAIRISDEVFSLKGQSTLFSLRNGGGKSVLVQMITAPFVHKRYRDAKDRPFGSYFTTNKPTFILVEWVLDQGAGYVLTGMMVRRSQEISQDQGEDLEIITLVSEYREQCQQDIYHLPVVEKTKKEMVLKGFHVCKQLFEAYKKDRSLHFTCYDMNNAAQSRQYFDKLMEYQINYKEWETIIKKVNLKESGLSDLFSDCKDERGLVEKWFLEAVENKLNRDKNRMKEFQTIIEKYVGQYKDNRSKIERRDMIRRFQEEAAGIRTQAGECVGALEDVKEAESRIACFIQVLERMNGDAQAERDSLLCQAEELHQEAEYVEYEKLSGEIHKLADEQLFHVNNREMMGMERDSLEVECTRIQKTLHLLTCAKQQMSVEESSARNALARQRLAVSRQTSEDLEPERNSLGYTLKLHYEEQLENAREQEKKNRQECVGLKEGIVSEKQKQASLDGELLEKTRTEGALHTQILSFDDREERFCRDCREDLKRTILGEYESGALDILSQRYHSDSEECSRQQLRLRRQDKELKERIEALQRLLEEEKTKRVVLQGNKEQNGREIGFLEEELAARRIILRYLELAEKDLFDTQKLVGAVERKMEETLLSCRQLEQEEDGLNKEYIRLTQGRVLELGEEFRNMLDDLSLHYVYGMDWLKKNGRSTKENQELVRSHPFLPYGLILSRKEVDRLAGHTKEVYTSFPIPIIVRETLEQEGTTDESGIVPFPQVSFYVLFNENLLDEEKLHALLEEKKVQLRKKSEAIAVRRQEHQQYMEKREKLRGQSVTKEKYEDALSLRGRLEEELEAVTREIGRQTEALSGLMGEAEDIGKQIRAGEQAQMNWKRRLEELQDFRGCYDRYLEQRTDLERLKKQMERLKEQKSLSVAAQGRLEEKLATCETFLTQLGWEISRLSEKQSRFAGFGEGTVLEGDGVELEARYQAVTEGITEEIKTLEAQVGLTEDKLARDREELAFLQVKFKLEPDAWSRTVYSREEENHQEEQLHGRKKQLQEKERDWNQEDKAAAVVSGRIEDCKKRMIARCHQEAPLPKEEIHTQDFDDRLARLHYEEKEVRKKAEDIQERIASYESNLTALAEYSHFKKKEEGLLGSSESRAVAGGSAYGSDGVNAAAESAVSTIEAGSAVSTGVFAGSAVSTGVFADSKVSAGVGAVFADAEARFTEYRKAAGFAGLSELTTKQLRDFKGTLVRDYNETVQRQAEKRKELDRLLNRIVRMEIFREDFYRKPLESMLLLTSDARQVLAQLDTTVQSYDRLLEKLEVDISLVEKERDKIIELLEDYLGEVHGNLGKIDVNSTITIREKPVKMLKIKLPDWEENVSLYQVRLRDFIDEITEKGMEIFGKNENAQEYFGARVTTKNIYDTVVGIGNVQIRLYKIEEQREYPITWAEVAKNSGGEGFLSAFIILSSLLYYMRKDDSDLFADRNEGKVLVMDNPFAQTNAAHLLRPLMDMARKTNTQLICLSGLGGESIYNRFDNIYVLNLMAASLRSGTQYLRADHIRGHEEETMVVSQVEVIEQQELIF